MRDGGKGILGAVLVSIALWALIVAGAWSVIEKVMGW